MSGTPEGLGPVSEGDRLEASLTYKGKVLATISDVIQKEKWNNEIISKIKIETLLNFKLTFSLLSFLYKRIF